MLRSLATIAAKFDIDNVASQCVERFYVNKADRGRLSRRFQILAYHKVSPDNHPFFEPVHPKRFEQQIRFLKKCFNVMPLGELVHRSQQGDIPARAVAVTFDDGYEDNYGYAFPILKKYGVPATIFIATGMIETGNVLWHDRVFDAFRYATKKRATFTNRDFPELVLETPETQAQSLR